MNVLVACEFSGIVRDAFRARGHNAFSCDLLPCESDPKWHFQEDIIRLLMMDVMPWDLMIAHPPCTYLCSSGLHWNKRVPGREAETEKALGFVKLLLDAEWIPRIALENPVGRINTAIRKPDQTIQPWMFGENASKGTCLWLKGLCPLVPTRIVPPAGWSIPKGAYDMRPCNCCDEPWCDEHGKHFAECGCVGVTEYDDVERRKINGVEFARRLPSSGAKPVWGNQTPSGQNKLGPSETRWKERSRTYPGIAQAMAEQWGGDAT